jgi:hypothetical protein
MSDDQEKKPALRVVSENHSVPKKAEREAQRDIDRARDTAQRALANFAATTLRTIAGSESASYNLMRDMGRLIEAQKELYHLSGEWMSFEDEQRALALPQAESASGSSDYDHRRRRIDRGMQDIVQGSLRLAAHQLLDERPHFGGKYSERLIETGIATINDANKPPPPEKPLTKKQMAANKVAQQALLDDLLSGNYEPQPRKKPWSSRDSRSYRDPKPEE